MQTNTWTKGKNGDWLVRGAAGQTARIVVTKRDGSTGTATIERQIWTDGTVSLYSVVSARASSASNYDPEKFNGYGRSRGGNRRACKTGGNCSSCGSGRSCGAYDCDGY